MYLGKVMEVDYTCTAYDSVQTVELVHQKPNGGVQDTALADDAGNAVSNDSSPRPERLVIFCTKQPAAVNLWTGARGDNKWETGGNWSLGRAPAQGDNALILGGAITTAGSLTKRIGSLTIAGIFNPASLGGNSVTIETVSITTTGNINVLAGGTITSSLGGSVFLEAKGSLTINWGATVRGGDGVDRPGSLMFPGGDGGAVNLQSPAITNFGTVLGGTGGISRPAVQGGPGGRVNIVSSGVVANTGLIQGGSGGTGNPDLVGNGGNVLINAKDAGGVKPNGGPVGVKADGLPGANAKKGKVTIRGKELVEDPPGLAPSGSIVGLYTDPGGTISLAGVPADTLVAEDLICIDAAGGTVDLTGISAGTTVMSTTNPGGVIEIVGTVLIDPGVYPADIAYPPPTLSSVASSECASERPFLDSIFTEVGGTAELRTGDSDSSALAAENQQPQLSMNEYAALAGGVVATIIVLAGGVWYARRRWLRP
ncbi:MAG: hypothetical protein Q7T33_00345 [Dehalococcoidia bacterium]|nr:hypothetical protein [Dehalococcoidia bacterium]